MKNPQSEKAKEASQRNLDNWEKKQAHKNMVSDNAGVFYKGVLLGVVVTIIVVSFL